MVDEDFVMGYAVGYNDGVGSGGGGGIIIKEGTSVYDVPIIHNYSLVGTEYGLATFDVNECAFLNNTPYNRSCVDTYRHPITGEYVAFKYPQPKGMSRNIAYAVTKHGKAIGIHGISRTYNPFSNGDVSTKIEDGSIAYKKTSYSTTTVQNPILSFEDIPSGDTQSNLYVYYEYDLTTYKISYNQPSSYYNSEYGFTYYKKSDLDAQVVSDETTTTNHIKVQIADFNRIIKSDNYPTELLNKYKISGLNNPIFGMQIMDDYEICTSFFDGIA